MDTSATSLVDRIVPDFALPALDGRPVAMADYRGRRVALFMWASW
jgi:cytochrome c biogenesis protein CcmG/thiol:disulfide interchange protein DsbE